MAITNIAISENNIEGDSDLMAVHNPLVFTINATFTGAAPELLYARVYDEDDVLLGTFKCIPYQDLTATIRQFMFIASDILRGFMDGFDDEAQSAFSLAFMENFTKVFNIEFDSQETPSGSEDEVEVVALHGVRQFGDNPNAENIFNNVALTYYGSENKPIYVYCYNDDAADTITITPGLDDDNFIEYDGDYFIDSSGNYFVGVGT